jgi:hypothetical protein
MIHVHLEVNRNQHSATPPVAATTCNELPAKEVFIMTILLINQPKRCRGFYNTQGVCVSSAAAPALHTYYSIAVVENAKFDGF